MRTTLRHLGTIGVFSLPSIAIFWHAWDGHLASTATCACSDAGQQIWFMAWPAYALSHGLNPFFSSTLWTPKGVNLLVNASSPLIGLVLAPVTWVWGPVASTNLALTLAPGLSSWGCWIACRHFVSWRWAAWAGGLMFGYSPFVFSNIRQGHLGLGVLVIPPLMLVLLDRILSAQTGPAWRTGALLGLLVAVQFLISAEVLVMGAAVSVVGVVAAAVLAARAWTRARVLYALRGLGAAVGTGAVLLAVPSWFTLEGPRHIVGSVWSGLNLFGISLSELWRANSQLSAVVTAQLVAAGTPPGVLGLTGPNPAYLGAGVLAVVVLGVVLTRRELRSWVLLAVGVWSCVLSLGAAGVRHGALVSLSWLPWRVLVKLPLLDDVLPSRFAVYSDLTASLLVAIGLDAARRWLVRSGTRGSLAISANWSYRSRFTTLRHRYARSGPTALACLAAVVVFVPIWVQYPIPTATQDVVLPRWFATTALRVPAGSVVLSYPFPSSASVASQPMIWQAVDHMRFRLAGGYVKVPGTGGHPLEDGPPGSAVDSLVMLTVTDQTRRRSWAPTPYELSALHGALARWRVSYVVLTTTGLNPLYTAAVMTAVIGRPPDVSEGAWVWNLRRARLTGSFDATAASGAFSTCRSTQAVYGGVPSGAQLPQQGNLCVSNALTG